MFNKKTVFILGAGASWHYGYPTGEELVRRVNEKADVILQTYQPLDEDWSVPCFYPDQYTEEKFQPFVNNLKEVKNRLSQANPLVIDDFLGRNNDIADVGKLLIAMVLLDCEKGSEPRPKKKDLEGNDYDAGDWIRHVVQHLIVDCDKPEDLLDNKVAFVTFNYDLSLEQRLYGALKNYQWFADGGHSDKFFSPGRIYHVYGQLRDFGTTGPSETRVSFGGEHMKLANEINCAWDASLALDKSGKPRIRTIGPHEKVAAPEIIEAIADAEYLYFLGYGFNRHNNALLGLGKISDMSRPQHVNFTNYGNFNKVSKSVERIYGSLGRVIDAHGISLGSLIGDHFQRRPMPSGPGPKFFCEKSIKSVYDALAQDFDWPE